MKRTIKIRILPIFILVLTLTGCGLNKYPLQPETNLKGRFLLYSFRDKDDKWASYVLKNQRLSLLEKNPGVAKWSPDGRYIAYYIIDNKIVLYDYLKKNRNQIQITAKANNLSWNSESSKIIYVTREGVYKKEISKFYIYDLNTKKHTLIKEFDELGHSILELSVSRSNKILYYDRFDSHIHLMDIDGNNDMIIRKNAMDSSWFPDGKHIGFFTNTADDGSRINDMHGAYFKMNIETGEKTKLRDLKSSDWHRKISPDGKYLYYSKAYKGFGRYIAVSPLDNPDVEIAVTTPIIVNREYSQDLDADWYQG